MLLAYSLESFSANRQLYEKYVRLAKFETNLADLNKQFDLVTLEDSERTKQDEKIYFSDKDKRKGMRFGLYNMQRKCAICAEVPKSMKPSSCSTCGKF